MKIKSRIVGGLRKQMNSSSVWTSSKETKHGIQGDKCVDFPTYRRQALFSVYF